MEEKHKAEEVEEKQRVEEVEEKWKKEEKDRAAKALADQVVADAEELWRPAMSKAVVPWSIRGVLSSEWTAHQIALEVAHHWEKCPRIQGVDLSQMWHQIWN